MTTATRFAITSVLATALALSSLGSFASIAGAQTSGGSCNFGTADMTVGSKGVFVISLQSALITKGYLVMPAGVAMGYFGPGTKAAVMKWQRAVGISPAKGYFGDKSRAKQSTLCSGAVSRSATGDFTGNDTSGPLATVSLPSNMHGTGDFSIPLTVTDLKGLGVLGLNFYIQYDPTIINITSVESAPAVPSSCLVVWNAHGTAFHNNTPGYVAITISCVNESNLSGVLVTLKGTTVASSGTTPIHFLNETGKDVSMLELSKINDLLPTTFVDGSFTVGEPLPSDPPTIESYTPASAVAGTPGTTISINGSNFTPASQVFVNDSPRITQFVSDTLLRVTLTTADLAYVTPLHVTVSDTAGTSDDAVANPGSLLKTIYFYVRPPSGVLALNITSPTTGAAWLTGSSQTVTWTTALLPADSKVAVGLMVDHGGGSRSVKWITTSINAFAGSLSWIVPDQVSELINNADEASKYQIFIQVIGVGGSDTQAQSGFITVSKSASSALAPLITSFGGPSSVFVGSAPSDVTINGKNFTPGSTVYVNGSSRVTRFIDSTRLVASMTADDYRTIGTYSLIVITPGVAARSNTLSFTVKAAAPAVTPTLTLTSPTVGASWDAGNPHKITWTSQNVPDGSLIQIALQNSANGYSAYLPIGDVPVSSGSYDWTIPSSLKPSGAYTIFLRVADVNPVIQSYNPNGYFTITNSTQNNPTPKLTVFDPTVVNVGSGAFDLTVVGSNFISNSAVYVDGSPRPTTFVNESKLIAHIPASDATTAHRVALAVVSPAPGGGSSNILNGFTVNPVTQAPTVALLTPTNGAIWKAGDPQTITWSAQNVAADATVNIALQNSDTGYSNYLSTYTVLAKTGSFPWTPPTNLPPSSTYNIYLYVNNGTAAVQNLTYNNHFTITNPNYQPASVLSGYGSVLGASSGFHYVWNSDLQIGSSNVADVTALQTALMKDGDYTGDITGGFYNQTFLAVKTFQEKYGISPMSGYVGAMTRAKLNELFK